jgi:hypothetical protein
MCKQTHRQHNDLIILLSFLKREKHQLTSLQTYQIMWGNMLQKDTNVKDRENKATHQLS